MVVSRLSQRLQHWPDVRSTSAVCGQWDVWWSLPPMKTFRLISGNDRPWPAQQTRNVAPMLGWCWPSIYDAGPASAQHWFNVSCGPLDDVFIYSTAPVRVYHEVFDQSLAERLASVMDAGQPLSQCLVVQIDSILDFWHWPASDCRIKLGIWFYFPCMKYLIHDRRAS